MSNAWRVFQTFYEKRVLQQHAPAEFAWIDMMQGALLELAGFVSGPLYDRSYVRSLVFVGTLLTVGGNRSRQLRGAVLLRVPIT